MKDKERISQACLWYNRNSAIGNTTVRLPVRLCLETYPGICRKSPIFPPNFILCTRRNYFGLWVTYWIFTKTIGSKNALSMLTRGAA